MQLHILLLTLVLFIYSRGQWIQTSREKFCHKVFECSKDSSRQIIPPANDYVFPDNATKMIPSANDNLLPENDTQTIQSTHGYYTLPDNTTNTICNHAFLCNKTSESACDIPYSLATVPEWFDTIQTTKTNFCSILNTCTNRSTIAISDDDNVQYLRNLSNYCPSIDYCGLTNTTPSVASCCVPCSCKPDCGLYRACCFASQDHYNVIEAEQMSCIALQTASLGKIGFYMLDKCPDGTDCYKQGSVPQPVSSACTKRIYINKECARCNGNFSASDVIPWQMAMTLGSFEQILNLINTHTFYPTAYSIPSEHRVWIVRYACGMGYKNSCKQSQPFDREILNACDRVHAPVVSGGVKNVLVFSSIYCMLCNGLNPRSITCPIIKDPTYKRRGLSLLLDMKVLQAHEQTGSCADTDIVLRRQVGCRPVLCPNWMLRVDGTCYYVAKQWTAVTISTQLILRPNDHMPTNLFQNMTKWDQFNVHTWLFNECGYDLNLSNKLVNLKLYMLSVEKENVMVVKEFLLRMKHVFNQLQPSSFFEYFERCINGRWRISRGNNSYDLSASLYPYKSFMPDGATRRSHVSLNKSLVESPLPRIYELITILRSKFYYGYNDGYTLIFNTQDVIPTKLDFCERVELLPEDVELLFGQIRVKKTDKLLGDNEFGAKYDGLDGDRLLNVRVCLSDFIKRTRTSSARSYNSDTYVGSGIALVVASFVWKL